MKKFFFDCGTRDATASLGILALRLLVGVMMLAGHGIPKIRQYAELKDGFHVPDFFPFKYMSPPVSLIANIGVEVGAVILIALGLATRPAAFLLGFSLVVAVFGYHGAAPWFVTPPAVGVSKEPGLLYLILIVVLIITGSGAYSLDAHLHRDLKRRRW